MNEFIAYIGGVQLPRKPLRQESLEREAERRRGGMQRLWTRQACGLRRERKIRPRGFPPTLCPIAGALTLPYRQLLFRRKGIE